MIITDNKAFNPILDFTLYRDAIVNMINNSYPEFTIGVFGDWGNGKTTLMDSVKKILDGENSRKIYIRYGLMFGNTKMKKNLH